MSGENKSSGGEEIYENATVVNANSSAPNLSAFRESLIDKPASVHNTDLDALETSTVNPEDAFRVFNGKIFSVPRTEFSFADAVEKRVESPMQRFSRLRSDLEQLKFDLDSMVTADENGGSSIWSVLQAETAKMLTSTDEMENHRAFELMKQHTGASEKALEKIVNGMSAVGTNVPQTPPPRTTASSAAASSSSAPAVSLQPSQLYIDQTLIDVEKRVSSLETLLGVSKNLLDIEGNVINKNPIFTTFPLVESVSKLEQRVSLLDHLHLDNLRSKANTLRSELESVVNKVKASSGHASQSSLLETKAVESARRVDDLAEKITKVEAVAEDLPSLVLRLKTLESVHLSASTFANRIATMEDDVQQLVGDVESNREVLAAMKEGLARNINVMKINVKNMDERIAKATGTKPKY